MNNGRKRRRIETVFESYFGQEILQLLYRHDDRMQTIYFFMSKCVNRIFSSILNLEKNNQKQLMPPGHSWK